MNERRRRLRLKARELVLRVAIVAIAVAALIAGVVMPWLCATRVARIAVATEAAWDAPRSAQSHAAAERHVAELRRCRWFVPTLIDCRFQEGLNLRLLLRHDEAARVYREALEIDRRPELYVALGITLVESGHAEEAITPFVNAGLFEPMYITDIYPEELRLRVDQIVSRRRLLPWHEVVPGAPR